MQKKKPKAQMSHKPGAKPAPPGDRGSLRKRSKPPAPVETVHAPADRTPHASGDGKGLARGRGHTPEIGHKLLYISRSQMSQLHWEQGETAHHVQLALRDLARGKIEAPAPAHLHPQRESVLTLTPALAPNMQACGARWMARFPTNGRSALPQVSALVVLNDPHTGFPLAVMDATWLIAQRAPAVSGLVISLLARQESQVAAIIGAGVQGKGHLEMLPSHLPALKTVRIFDRDAGAAQRLAREFKAPADRRIQVDAVASAQAAVRNADVVLSATAVTDKPEPVIGADQLRPGALALSLDLDAVFKPDVFEKADRFFVDWQAHLDELRGRGLFAGSMPDHLAGQLDQLLGNRVAGRGGDAERIVFLCVGIGCLDVVLARAVYDKACCFGAGVMLEL